MSQFSSSAWLGGEEFGTGHLGLGSRAGLRSEVPRGVVANPARGNDSGAILLS